MRLSINARVLQSDLTGVQRYALELMSRLGPNVDRIDPSFPLSGVKGHAWEQLILPARLGRRFLFSPSTTGPLGVKRQVVTMHDVVPLDHPEWLNPRFAAWYRFLIPRLSRRIAHVITISEFSKQRLLEHVPMDENRVSVIPNGVDGRFQVFSETELSDRLPALELPSRHYILCVGSLEPRKNLCRLLQAWQHIQTELPQEIWLILTGKKGNERIFAKTAGLNKLPPKVHLTGHVSDEHLPALYAGATAFVFPSVYEGFGLPPLEAMASGVPVLTGNRTALPEVIGDAGVMVDPYDVDALAEGLLRILGDSDLRKKLRQKGLERVKRFSWDITAQRTWAVLEGEAST